MPLFSRFRQATARKREEQALDRKSGFTTNWLDLGPARWGSRSYARLAEEGYRRNVVAHRCVRMIAECAAAVPLKVPADQADHPAMRLLAMPNAQDSGTVFQESMHAHLQIGGNAYIEMIEGADGLPQSLYLLRPDRVTPQAGPGGWPEAYEHRVDGKVRQVPAYRADGVRPILHLKQFHPLDDQRGLGAIDAAAYAIDIHNAASAWNKALLDNGARPSGALVFAPADGRPDTLSDTQMDRLKQELADHYQGPSNAGRPFLLEGGLTWQPMAMSPSDMDFMQSKNGAARDIALAFGVPPMLLGIPGDNTYANYQEANRAFWRLTLIPLVSRVADQLGHWLALAYGRPLKLTPDLDQVPALAPEREAFWNRVNMATFLSDEEKRRMLGVADRSE